MMLCDPIKTIVINIKCRLYKVTINIVDTKILFSSGIGHYKIIFFYRIISIIIIELY